MLKMPKREIEHVQSENINATHTGNIEIKFLRRSLDTPDKSKYKNKRGFSAQSVKPGRRDGD